MKRMFALVAIVLCLILAPLAHAANTVTQAKGVVNLVLDSDWTWTTTYPHLPNGLVVECIIFHPGAASDVLVLRSDSTNGPYIFPPMIVSGAEDTKILYFYGGKELRIFIDYDTSTLTAGHVIIIHHKSGF